MSLFSMFGAAPDINTGVRRCRETEGAVLLDVRTPEEYAGGHIPGSVNLPLDAIASIQIPREVPLFVYCRSGARSSQAVSWLKTHGYPAQNIGGILNYSGSQE